MKTETQIKLEKEIEKITLTYTPQNVPFTLGNKVLNLQAKLTQHLTDIKNFEKLIAKKKFNGDVAYNYTNTKMMFLNAEEIKEALKEL